MYWFQIAMPVALPANLVLMNVYWYHAKRLLRARGYPSSLFIDHLSDLGYLALAIVAERDVHQRDLLIRLRRNLKASVFVFLALFGNLLLSCIVRPLHL